MKKRQEKPYAAQVAALSKPKLTAEIGRLIQTNIASPEDITSGEQLSICIAEDDSRGGTCYPKAIAQVNESLGYRQTGPGQFDLREAHGHAQA